MFMLLITGATGYVGRHLVARLVAQGQRPRCLVRDLKRAASILPANDVELVQGDTTQTQTLQAELVGVDTIVHAAFITADRKPVRGSSYDQTNVEGTRNLVKAAQEVGVKCIIEISGLGTHSDKSGSYMQGRYLAEQAVIKSNLHWTIIRPSVLFGKNAPFTTALLNLMRTSPVVPLIGGGKVKFQPIDVDDVITIILKVLEEPERTNKQIYTVGGPEYYSFTELVNALMHAAHLRRLKVWAPLPFVVLGATAMEAVLPKPPLTKAATGLFTFDNITDLDSVERQFGFQPHSLNTFLREEGI
jgi:NADH dehydrogenase